MFQTMSKEQRAKNISILFERQTAGIEQLTAMLQSRYGRKIADGVLDQFEAMQGQISRHFSELLGQDKYSPSVRYEIKKLLSGQIENLKTLRLAVEADPAKVKMIGKWLFNNSLQLKGLSGLF